MTMEDLGKLAWSHVWSVIRKDKAALKRQWAINKKKVAKAISDIEKRRGVLLRCPGCAGVNHTGVWIAKGPKLKCRTCRTQFPPREDTLKWVFGSLRLSCLSCNEGTLQLDNMERLKCDDCERTYLLADVWTKMPPARATE